VSKNRDRQDVARQQQQGPATRGAIAVSAQVSGYSGPLPPPEELKGYEEVLPGAAERIVAAFEKESNHRREIERAQADTAGYAFRHELADRRTGLWLGFLVSIGGFVLAYALGKQSPAAGAGVVIAQVTGLATVFITGRRSQAQRESKELQRPE
jgi:uncharacterized membrane protein